MISKWAVPLLEDISKDQASDVRFFSFSISSSSHFLQGCIEGGHFEGASGGQCEFPFFARLLAY
jgi:hypothetical protein